MSDLPPADEVAAQLIVDCIMGKKKLMDRVAEIAGEFELWCAELRKIAQREPFRYGPDPIEACGPEAWRYYFEDGYSPEDAWAEDGTYD